MWSLERSNKSAGAFSDGKWKCRATFQVRDEEKYKQVTFMFLLFKKERTENAIITYSPIFHDNSQMRT